MLSYPDIDNSIKIVIGTQQYLLENRSGSWSNILEVDYQTFLDKLVDCEYCFVRKLTYWPGPESHDYWDINFCWTEFLNKICKEYLILDDIEHGDGYWQQFEYIAPWNKSYYYVDYADESQGDNGQRINSTRQDAWSFI